MKNNILFKNINFFNRYLLIVVSILIVLTSGLTSYAMFSSDTYGTHSILVRIKEFILPVVNTVTKARNTTNKNVVVTANLTDNKGVVDWQYSTTNTVPTTWRTITSATSTNQTFSTTTAETYYVWAKDAAGNISLSNNISISTIDVDFTAPVIGTLTKARNGTNKNVGITVPITDNIGVVSWQYTTSNTAPSSWRAITSTTSTSQSFTVTAASTYYIWAKDAAGNVSSKSIAIAATDVDFTAPVITLIKGSVSSPLPISVKMTDNVGVTTWYDPTYGWRNITSTTSTTLSFSVSSANTYTVYAKDAAGNQGSASITIATTNLIQLTSITGTYTGSAIAAGTTINKSQISISYIYNVASYNHTGTASACTLSSNTLPSNLRVTVTCSENGYTKSVVVYIKSSFAYSYTGSYQTFTVPATGYYTIQLYGAAGGNSVDPRDGYGTNILGGAGGYVSGKIYLNQGSTYYIYVGGKGTDGGTATQCNVGAGIACNVTCNNTPPAGGWNGGGAGSKGYCGTDRPGSGGGGATDIRSGGTALGNRIMVAGGGGGSSNVAPTSGGAGGNPTGASGNYAGEASRVATGGTQSAGGSGANCSGYAPRGCGTGGNGSLGVGGGANTSVWGSPADNIPGSFQLYGHGGGGGGGYYGGGGGGFLNYNSGSGGVTSGAGGSSYISSSFSSPAHTQGARSNAHGYAAITFTVS